MKTQAFLGPGRYEPVRVSSAAVSNTGAVSFKLREKRLKYIYNKNPAPGDYNLKRDIVEEKKLTRPSSCFVPKQSNQKIQDYNNNNIRLHDIKARLVTAKNKVSTEEFKIPGPGYYEAALSKDMIKDHKPITIEGTRPFQNQNSRFRENEKEFSKKVPGPGTYKEIETFDKRRFLVNNAVFMSESERIAFNNKIAIEGLGDFDPIMKPRKTHFMNNKYKRFVV